ncbi:Pentatricopeptide repeat domain-containing protein [Pleurostoma richardsiae]|uniref:Pentatricopeptide repeat domain-containing protein n=1 Tax=Pleurostoma richardsiae TaxID=41990 RepID=A0AA38VFW6_9PEZI|nr:Pentatricopeptide repeat domain-containing protein [Pleurostoma richardsiae]
MSAAQVIVDGLWRCLCPSVDAGFLAKAVARRDPFKPRALRLPSPAFRCLSPVYGPSQQYRALHSRRQATQIAKESRKGNTHRRDEGDSAPNVSLLARTAPPYKELKSATTAMIYESLREFCSGIRGTAECRSAAERVAVFIKHLIEDRGEEPNTLMYEALVLANADTQGSAEAVKELLKEMRDTRMQWSSSVYHYALLTLAVHPDYLLRNTILAEMRERWIESDPQGIQSVAIGLLRDGQYELALEKLDHMCRQDLPVEPWVYDLFIYVLGQMGFVDEAVRIVHHRTSLAMEVPLNVWYFVLDICSQAMHYEGTKYAWNKTVQPCLLSPSDGIALNVINCASRQGDSGLVMEAIQYISSRDTKLGKEHFEGLMDSYMAVGDVENALNVLCIMNDAGMLPGRGSTRSVYLALKRSAGLVDQAIQALFSLKARTIVPIAAFNVVIEGAVGCGQFDKALDLYRRVREVCKEGPDAVTFQPLFEACRQPAVVDFLKSEMEAFSLTRGGPIDRALVNVHSRYGDHVLALRFFTDAMRSGGTFDAWATFNTVANREMVLALLERCLREGDDAAWSVLEACKEKGMDLTADARHLVDKIHAEASEQVKGNTGKGGGHVSQTVGAASLHDSRPSMRAASF